MLSHFHQNLSLPFAVGEAVTLQLNTMVISGVVTRVDALRTVLRTEDDATVALPNKMVVEMVIVNRSRGPGEHHAVRDLLALCTRYVSAQ